MPRTENDTWDLASSVGATATMVAAARAVASRATSPVIDDPFAEPLVRAVGIDFFTRLASGDLALTELDSVATGGVGNMSRFADGMAARTRYFDAFFEAANAAGIRQAVILAAGLDARAYRLDWPAGTVVFELDQPAVIAAKTAAMAKIGAEPTARLCTVAVDLRDDWPKALHDNAFDPSKPTAWIAEGLLMYLPPEAQDRLFDNITALSAPGSRIATEFHGGAYGAELADRARTIAGAWQGEGFDIDFTELFHHGERNHVVDYLDERGWQVHSRDRREMFTDYGRRWPFPPGEPGGTGPTPLQQSVAVTAIRTETTS